MRNMGGLRTRMRTTFIVYLVGALALAGIFPFAGFWSKDEILAESISLNPWALVMLVLAAFLTAFYMGRQVFMVFFGKPRTTATEHAHENKPIITIPLIALAVLTVFGGALNLPQLHTFTEWLEHSNETIHAGKFVLWIALLASALSLLAIFLAWWIYMRRRSAKTENKQVDDPLRKILGGVFTMLENKYWVDEVYWALILNPYIALSRFLADVVDWRFWHDWFHEQVIARGFRSLSRFLSVQVDLGIIDGIANGLAAITQRAAGGLRLVQTGYVRNYALGILLGLVVILGYLILK